MKVKHGYQEKEVKRILFSKKLGFGFWKQCFPTVQYQFYFNYMYKYHKRMFAVGVLHA